MQSTVRGGVEDTRLEAKAKDSPTKNRPSRGQGQEYSRPRTQEQVLSKKRVFRKIFLVISKKRGLQKNILGDIKKKKSFPKKFFGAPQTFNNSKNAAVLEPRTGEFLRT